MDDFKLPEGAPEHLRLDYECMMAAMHRAAAQVQGSEGSMVDVASKILDGAIFQCALESIMPATFKLVEDYQQRHPEDCADDDERAFALRVGAASFVMAFLMGWHFHAEKDARLAARGRVA